MIVILSGNRLQLSGILKPDKNLSTGINSLVLSKIEGFESYRSCLWHFSIFFILYNPRDKSRGYNIGHPQGGFSLDARV